MSGASQGHGFVIESLMVGEIRRQAHLNGNLPVERGYTERFDAPGYQDPYGRGIPTSVKACKRKADGDALICLADAARITEMAEVPEMRLMVAIYDQVQGKKVFSEIREYILRADEWTKLVGGAPKDVLQDFSKAIKDPDPTKARAIAKEWKAHMAEEYPAVLRWNPKIDSKGQRRVQCSVLASEIEAVIKDKRRIRVFGKVPASEQTPRPKHLRPVSSRLWGVGVGLPVVVESAVRHRHPKPVVETASTELQEPAASAPIPAPRARRPGR